MYNVHIVVSESLTLFIFIMKYVVVVIVLIQCSFIPLGVAFDVRRLSVGDFTWIAREKASPVPGLTLSGRLFHSRIRSDDYNSQVNWGFQHLTRWCSSTSLSEKGSMILPEVSSMEDLLNKKFADIIVPIAYLFMCIYFVLCSFVCTIVAYVIPCT